MDLLRYHRENKGWSQEQLARYSGVSRSTVQRIERGSIRPSRETAQSLAAALDVQPSVLREAAGRAALIGRYMEVAHKRRLSEQELARLPADIAKILIDLAEARAQLAENACEASDRKIEVDRLLGQPTSLPTVRELLRHAAESHRTAQALDDAMLRYTCASGAVQNILHGFR